MLGTKNQYYVEYDGLATGPFDQDTIREKISSHEFTPDTRVYHRSHGAWLQLAKMREFHKAFPQPKARKLEAIPEVPVLPPSIPTRLIHKKRIRVSPRVQLSHLIGINKLPIKKIEIHKRLDIGKKVLLKKISIHKRIAMNIEPQIFVPKPIKIEPPRAEEIFTSKAEEMIYLHDVTAEEKSGSAENSKKLTADALSDVSSLEVEPVEPVQPQRSQKRIELLKKTSPVTREFWENKEKVRRSFESIPERPANIPAPEAGSAALEQRYAAAQAFAEQKNRKAKTNRQPSITVPEPKAEKAAPLISQNPDPSLPPVDVAAQTAKRHSFSLARPLLYSVLLVVVGLAAWQYLGPISIEFNKSGEKEPEWASRPPSPAMKKLAKDTLPPPKPPVRPSREPN